MTPPTRPTDGTIRRVNAAPDGPHPVGPYSQATIANGFIFTSGQIPTSSDGSAGPDSFAEQVRLTLINLLTVLETAGSDAAHIVKINAYLNQPGDMAVFNEIYREILGTHRPARTTVGVGLWDIPLEIDCIATIPHPDAGGFVGEVASASVSASDHDRADADLLAGFRSISFPTIGHFLEDGFLDHRIRSLVPGAHIAGPAVTVNLPVPDATLVNRAICALRPGAVLVIDTGGNSTHAVVGAVTATAIKARGAAAVIIDGLATDLAELQVIGLPVFARGTTLLTSKLLGTDFDTLDSPVSCGGITVRPGDIVIADDNGVAALAPHVAREVLPLATASDAAEPDTLTRLRSGEPPSDVLLLTRPH